MAGIHDATSKFYLVLLSGDEADLGVTQVLLSNSLPMLSK